MSLLNFYTNVYVGSSLMPLHLTFSDPELGFYRVERYVNRVNNR